MAVMTLRGIDEVTLKALKEKAGQEGVSINSALLKMLKKELGLEKKKRTVVYNDLDHLAGTWTEKDFLEFKKNTEDFEKIDVSLWK